MIMFTVIPIKEAGHCESYFAKTRKQLGLVLFECHVSFGPTKTSKCALEPKNGPDKIMGYLSMSSTQQIGLNYI